MSEKLERLEKLRVGSEIELRGWKCEDGFGDWLVDDGWWMVDG